MPIKTATAKPQQHTFDAKQGWHKNLSLSFFCGQRGLTVSFLQTYEESETCNQEGLTISLCDSPIAFEKYIWCLNGTYFSKFTEYLYLMTWDHMASH